MSPRKKPTNTKAADKTVAAAKASNEDQPKADDVTQAGAGAAAAASPAPASGPTLEDANRAIIGFAKRLAALEYLGAPEETRRAVRCPSPPP